MSTTLLKSGDRISEYLLEEKIGQGGFGEVWRARHHIWEDQKVAVKIPLNDAWVRRLKKEGVIQHDLGTDGIVKTLGLDPDHEPPYLILEYVEGGSLRKAIEEEGRFPVKRALEIAAAALRVLEGAHQRGITHGDIKPENILLEKSGKVMLADFGLSQVMEDAAKDDAIAASLFSQDGEGISGTIAYMSPEQKDPRRKVDHRTDIYSLGLVLFEMLTGALPEGGEVPSDLNPAVPPGVDRIFRRCYSRVGKRFATSLEAIEAIEKEIAGLTPPRREEARRPEPSRSGGLLAEKEAASFLRVDIVDFRRRVASGEIKVRRQNGEEGFRLIDLAPIRRRVRDEAQRARRARYRPPRVFAGFWVRFAAFVIDVGIFVAFAIWTGLGPFLLPSLPIWLSVYGVIGHSTAGKTIGKWLLGIKVVRNPRRPHAGPPMHPGIALLRLFGKIFSWVSLLMGFFMVGFHPEKRALHDLIAETWVVYDPSGRMSSPWTDPKAGKWDWPKMCDW